MRSSTRPSLFALVIGLWIISCAIVLASVLVAPPASGQAPESGEWSPREVRVVESAGEIVLTFTSSEPGRIGYWTREDCPTYPWDPQHCRQPMARAGEDYGAVKGEWIFTEAGSRTITIPIIDDDLDEADFETFFVDASSYDDVAEQTAGWYTASIHIEDDDPRYDPEAPPARTAPTATTAGGRSSSSSDANAIPGSDDGDTEVQPGSGSELASGELEPVPGFELAIERDAGALSERDGRSGGSASWLAFGLGATALGSGGVVWVRRRRRLSPTRS